MNKTRSLMLRVDIDKASIAEVQRFLGPQGVSRLFQQHARQQFLLTRSSAEQRLRFEVATNQRQESDLGATLVFRAKHTLRKL